MNMKLMIITVFFFMAGFFCIENFSCEKMEISEESRELLGNNQSLIVSESENYGTKEGYFFDALSHKGFAEERLKNIAQQVTLKREVESPFLTTDPQEIEILFRTTDPQDVIVLCENGLKIINEHLKTIDCFPDQLITKKVTKELAREGKQLLEGIRELAGARVIKLSNNRLRKDCENQSKKLKKRKRESSSSQCQNDIITEENQFYNFLVLIKLEEDERLKRLDKLADLVELKKMSSPIPFVSFFDYYLRELSKIDEKRKALNIDGALTQMLSDGKVKPIRKIAIMNDIHLHLKDEEKDLFKIIDHTLRLVHDAQK